jgi:hypothetical protein
VSPSDAASFVTSSLEGLGPSSCAQPCQFDAVIAVLERYLAGESDPDMNFAVIPSGGILSSRT